VVGPSTLPRPVRYHLPNGLEVLLDPVPGATTVSVWVWYRVGSKNEWPGVTGASHWVEHMLFLGSPKFGKGAIDKAIVGVGGELNAFTDTDFTAYFTTVPSEHLAVPLAVEADRMTRALLVPAEVERERTIIRSEREGAENWPEFLADEELYNLAFKSHPYRWDPLGLPGDILALTPADLAAYYHRFYGPRNAILLVSGGFDVRAVRSTIAATFRRLPATGADPVVRLAEGPSTAARRAELRGPGTTPFIDVGWRAPAIGDAGAVPLLVLDALLGGESRLFSNGAPGSRSREHPSSRLYRRLVDAGLAVGATSGYRPRVHPSLFTIHAQAAAGRSIEAVERAVEAELHRISRDGPSAAELREVATKFREAVALAYEGATQRGFRLGYLAAIGGPGIEARLLRGVGALTPSRVREAARDLFRSEARCTVVYRPEVPHGS